MLRWLLFLVAVALLALGCLTVVKSPDGLPWQLAVLAGEFGHWLAIAALFIGLVGWWLRGEHRGVAGVVLLCGIAGTFFLLTPAFQAWRIAGDLPAKFAAQFPAGRAPGIPFSVKQLFLGQDPAPVPMQTLKVAEGLPLDFYRVPAGGGTRGVPCVIVVHGGGWDGGDRRQIPELNHWLARRGYAVAAISYRLAPKFRWPKQGDDLMTAIAFLKERANELGIDPGRLVLLGRSAGGQIAEMVAYTAGDPAIRGVIGLYTPSDLYFGYVNTHENDALRSPALMRQYLGGPPETARAIYDAASPLLHVTKDVPPTLLLHGQNDTLVWHRHSERLETALKENGVPSVFVSLPWATHAFEFNLHGPGGQLTTFSLGWFLSAVTK
jgi:acetyl esterase/lipase